MAESIKLKAILHLMKLRVLLYGWSYFSEMRPASLLKATMADGPQPPLVDRTSLNINSTTGLYIQGSHAGSSHTRCKSTCVQTSNMNIMLCQLC